jgi:hypothetical protein
MIEKPSQLGAGPRGGLLPQPFQTRLTRRRVIASGGAAGVTVLAAGCGGASPAPPAASAQPVKVTYMSRNAVDLSTLLLSARSA